MLLGGEPRQTTVSADHFTRLTTANPDALVVLTAREWSIDVDGRRFVVARVVGSRG